MSDMYDPIQGRGGQRDWGGDTAALGGYGAAGLFSRRRQMERTDSGSFLHQAHTTGGSAPSTGVDFGSGTARPATWGFGMARGVAPTFERTSNPVAFEGMRPPEMNLSRNPLKQYGEKIVGGAATYRKARQAAGEERAAARDRMLRNVDPVSSAATPGSFENFAANSSLVRTFPVNEKKPTRPRPQRGLGPLKKTRGLRVAGDEGPSGLESFIDW